MSLTQTLLIPLAFGLVGFVEPCSIGIHLGFLGTMAGAGPAQRMAGVLTFTLVRAVVMATVGLSAAWIGQELFAWQSRWFVVLGLTYFAAGAWMTFGRGILPGLMRIPWFSGAWLASRSGTHPLLFALLGGLTIPACAIPLVAVLVGQTIMIGDLIGGALALLVFAVALSLPLVPIVMWHGGHALLARISRAARRHRRWLGIAIMLIGLLTLLSSRWWGLGQRPRRHSERGSSAHRLGQFGDTSPRKLAKLTVFRHTAIPRSP